MRAGRTASAVAAVLLPALIIGAAWSWLARPEGSTVDERAQAVQEELQAAPPDVIVLGNSIARSNVHPAKLGAAAVTAGADHAEVAKLAIGGTTPPVWYAMARRSVYDAGFQPKVIVVVSVLKTLFFTEVNTTNEAQRLREILGTNDEDADILRKATGRRFLWPAMERANSRGVALRDDVVQHYADLVVGPDAQGTPARERIDDATAAIFDADGAVDLDLFKRVIPVLQDPKALEHQEKDRPIADTFLPDLAELAEEHDAHLVIVRVPVSASRKKNEPDDRLAELVAWANDHDVGYVDLSDLDVNERHFRDGQHLNGKGQAIFSEVLGQELVQLGVFGQGELAKAELPLPDATLSRQGTPPVFPVVQPADLTPYKDCTSTVSRPDLAPYGTSELVKRALWYVSPLRFRVDGEVVDQVRPGAVLEGCEGLGMAGDDLVVADVDSPIEPFLDPAPIQINENGMQAAWILPGAPLVVSAGPERVERWGTQPVTLEVVVQPLDPSGERTQLRIGHDSTELGEREGGLFVGEVELTAVPATFTLASEQATVVRMIRLSGADNEEVLFGEAEQAGHSIVRVFDQPDDRAHYSGPPPQLAPHSATLDQGQVVFQTPDLGHMNTLLVAKKSEKYNCSPVMVTLDGQALDAPQKGCRQLEKPGRMCHSGKEVRYVPRAEDPTDPARYGLMLNPDRYCRRWSFLHPGDELVVEAPKYEVFKALGGLEQLELTAVTLDRKTDPKKAPMWTVELSAGDKTVLSREFSIADLRSGVFRTRLKPFSRKAKVQVRLRASDQAPPMMIGYIVLHETPQVQAAAEPADKATDEPADKAEVKP